ncbi:MAG: flagellar basal-body rod protein FlgF [Pseudomonadota bacterium]
MSNSILIGLSQQTVLRQHMDIVANNLANLGTTSYKAETPLFEDYLLDAEKGDADEATLHFVRDYGIFRDLGQGKFQTTDRPLDIAVNGMGYLVVETGAGERYMRGGSFRLDADGQIVTPGGDPLLGDNGRPVRIDGNNTDLTIAKDGTISGGAGIVGRLQVVEFDNDHALRKAGEGLYTTDEIPQPTDRVELLQGMLESSNVEPIIEMTKLIQISRAYASASKLMEASGDLTRRAVQTLGRTQG